MYQGVSVNVLTEAVQAIHHSRVKFFLTWTIIQRRGENVQEINGVGRPFQIHQPVPAEKTERKPRVEGESLSVGEKLNISELLREAKESPEVREKLVEQLRAAIEQGIYTIDPERIAKHIMRQL